MTGLLSRLFRALPLRWRYAASVKAFRHSASLFLEGVSETRDNKSFQTYLQQFFDIFTQLIGKAAKVKTSDPDMTRSLLRMLLKLDNELYRAISIRACEYDRGSHPKHRLTGYHNFFCCNVAPGETVLDIGCGNGFLTSDIAKCTTGRVVGIDMNKENIEFARSHFRANNLEFVLGDVTAGMQNHCFDVVVMSNVLEHLSNRVEFLSGVRDTVQPKKLLLRVPMFEREWMAPLKKELGVDYMLDPTHKIEHRQEEFFEELRMAGFQPEYCELKWGEIWCRAQPGAPERGEDGE